MVIKIRIISKKASNNSTWPLNFIRKNQWAHKSISRQGELRRSKDGHFRNKEFTKTVRLIHFRAERCQKYALDRKRLQNKSSWAFNFVWKSQRAHKSISHQRGAKGPRRWPFSKYVQKIILVECRFSYAVTFEFLSICGVHGLYSRRLARTLIQFYQIIQEKCLGDDGEDINWKRKLKYFGVLGEKIGNIRHIC